MANNDKKLITAEEINKLYREHIEKPMEEAHPPARKILEEHKADTKAHNIPKRIQEVLLKHKQDPNAHKDALVAMDQALKFHTHRNLVNRSLEKLKPLLDFHIEYGHPALRAKYQKAHIIGNPRDWLVLREAVREHFFKTRNSYNTYHNPSFILNLLGALVNSGNLEDLPEDLRNKLSSEITAFSTLDDLQAAVEEKVAQAVNQYCFVLDLYKGVLYYHGGKEYWSARMVRRVK
jgi:hypothetical protein